MALYHSNEMFYILDVKELAICTARYYEIAEIADLTNDEFQQEFNGDPMELNGAAEFEVYENYEEAAKRLRGLLGQSIINK